MVWMWKFFHRAPLGQTHRRPNDDRSQRSSASSPPGRRPPTGTWRWRRRRLIRCQTGTSPLEVMLQWSTIEKYVCEIQLIGTLVMVQASLSCQGWHGSSQIGHIVVLAITPVQISLDWHIEWSISTKFLYRNVIRALHSCDISWDSGNAIYQAEDANLDSKIDFSINN